MTSKTYQTKDGKLTIFTPEKGGPKAQLTLTLDLAIPKKPLKRADYQALLEDNLVRLGRRVTLNFLTGIVTWANSVRASLKAKPAKKAPVPKKGAPAARETKKVSRKPRAPKGPFDHVLGKA